MAPKNPCQGKHREFGNFAKTQGIWFAQVVKYFDICHENFEYFLQSTLPRQFYVFNIKKLRKMAQGKFAVGQGKHRKFENAI